MNKSILILSAAVLMAACGNKQAETDASGVFEATEVTVSAQVNGQLENLNVQEGEDVRAGEEVGLIDTTQFYWQRRQLLAQQRATGRRTLSQDQQTGSLRQQIQNLQAERQRFSGLLREGAATQKQVDDLDYQIETLKKQLAAQTEQLQQQNSGVTDQTDAVGAQLGLVEMQLEHCHVKAPVTGTVLVKYMEAGEYAAPGKPLFKVADLGHIFLRAYLTADQVTAIKLGQEVRVYADLGEKGQKEYKGKISWISDKAEFTPKTIQTRDERANLVYAVKIAVRNDGLIKSGMYGEVKF